MRWHYKEIEKRKGVRYNDCRSVTNPPTKNRKVSLLGTGGKIGEYLLILADFLFFDGLNKFQTGLKLKCYKCCVSYGCKQKRIMVQYFIFFLRGEVLYDSNNRLRRREFTKRKKSS